MGKMGAESVNYQGFLAVVTTVVQATLGGMFANGEEEKLSVVENQVFILFRKHGKF